MAAILGLHQFSTPNFSIPDIPAEERPLHKLKDFASFLHSLQWKADDDESPIDSEVDTPKHFANPEVKNREQAEQRMMGLDPSLSSGNDVTLGVGRTRWDGHNTDFDNNGWMWEQAINSIVNGENPIEYGSLSRQLEPIESMYPGVFEEPTKLQKGVSSLNKTLADNDRKYGYQAFGGV